MPNNFTMMRFSLVLASLLTVSATICLSSSAEGQTVNSSRTNDTSTSEPKVLSNASNTLQSYTVPEWFSWTQTTIPTKAIPLAGRGGVPQQELPDRIRIKSRTSFRLQPTIQTLTALTPTSTPIVLGSPTLEAHTPPTEPLTPGSYVPTIEQLEPQGSVFEVLVKGVQGDLQNVVYKAAIHTRPGRTTTRALLQEDINAIFATGYFSNVKAVPEDTPLGVRVTFEVTLNPVLQKVQLQGTTVLPESVVQDAFKDQYGSVLNLVQLQEGIKKVNKWYQDNGYVLAQVVEAPKVSPDGVVTLDVAEGVVENITVRFVNKEGDDKDAKGNPIRGKTRPYIITREFETKPGQVFNRAKVERDLQQVYGLGIFEDIKLSLQPGEDPRKVVIVANVVERNTGSVAAGGGIDSKIGIFGSFSYKQDNLFGKAQKLNLDVNIGVSIVQIQTLVKSSGSVKIDQQDRLSNFGFKSLSELNLENGRSLAIEKLLSVLEIAKRENRKAEYALTLNNLGNIYSEIENYSSAINAYKEAQKCFHELNSHGLELLMFIQLAALYKENSQPEQALLNYYQALDIINSLLDIRELETVVGKTVSKVLSREWQIGDEDEIGTSFYSILPILKTSILLDIVATYTALGDYQQALYLVNSPELAHANQILAEKIQSLLSNLALENIDINFKDLDPSTKRELKSLLLEALKSIKSEVISFAARSNDLFKLLALNFIYTDLDDQSIASLYHKEYQRKFGDIDKLLQVGVNRVATLSRKYIDVFNINDLFLKDSVVKAAEIIEKWSTPNRSAPTDSTINKEELKKDVEPLVNGLSDYFLTSENFRKVGLTSEEVKDFGSILKSAIPLIINSFLSTADNSVLVDLSEEILNGWSRGSNILKQYEWVKGFIYYLLLSEYYEKREYQKAINSYNYFVAYEKEVSTFLEKFFVSNDLREVDSEISLTSNKIESYFEREDVGALGKKITYFLKNYRSQILYLMKSSLIFSSKQAADSYLEINEPLKAKILYQKILLLKDEIPKTYPSIAKGIGKILEKGELSEIYYGIAQSDLILGNLDEAQSNIEKAIRITETFIPRDFLPGVSGFTKTKMQYGYGFPNQGYLSASFSATLSNPWVIPWSSERVNDYYELRDALDNINNRSSSLRLPEKVHPCSTILDYFTCRQNYFELYIAILTKRNQQFPSEQFDILAFEQSERARTRSIQVLANLNDPLVNYGKLSSTQKRLLERKVRLSNPASITTIRKELLDENTLILEYFLGEKNSYLWLVSKHEELQTFELPSRSTIEEKAKDFYNLLTSPIGRVRPQTTAKVGKELSSLILGPVSNQLEKKRLVIVGDGFLQYLPFAVLPDPNSNNVLLRKGLQGEFAPYFEPLLLNHEIISLPSASSLVALRQDRFSRPKPKQELAFFADSVFNHEDKRVRGLKIGGGDFQPFKIANLKNVDVLYGALPNTSRELSKAFRIIPSSQRRSFLGFNANLKNALNPNLGHFKIVHFASHGIFNSQAPLRSGILLSSINEQGEVQPSLLSAPYAYRNMDLSATELVVLSGCRTGFGIGDVAREGLTGFTGGLLSAGTDRVIASLWSVQDEATHELMSRFYERMLDRDNPMSPAQALRAAQISMWEEPRWQTPYYWAAFIIQGEWK